MLLTFLRCSFIAFIFETICAAKEVAYETEPGFKAENFIHVYQSDDKAAFAPGYLFLALMDRGRSWGPRIYQSDGELIWYGSPSIGNSRITDFHPCKNLGTSEDHLCWHDRDPPPPGLHKDHAVLRKIWLDNTYALVENYSTLGDAHEFNVVGDGSTFVTLDYKRTQWDLRPYCGAQDGYIFDQCIVDYDVRSAEELFRWCSTDYLPVHTALVYPEEHEPCQTNATTRKAGQGDLHSPWDIGHLNAVDQTASGDYVASFRHFDEVMRIAGSKNTDVAPGTIMWRLGGRGNQFKKHFTFSRQHMVRIVDNDEDASTMTIALFNNAWEGQLEPSANVSSGQVIRLNTRNMHATLEHDYPHPHGKLAPSRGSMEVLSNGNAFVGWGTIPEVSEYAQNGTLLYHAQFAPLDTEQYSYRAFKKPWVANPSWPPKIVAYSKTCGRDAPLVAYASWNGATEVQNWSFRTSMRPSGPWSAAEVFPRLKFETKALLAGVRNAKYVRVEALDKSGVMLGFASAAIMIPTSKVAGDCSEETCTRGIIPTLHGEEALQTCPRHRIDLLSVLGLVVICAVSETFMAFFHTVLPRKNLPRGQDLNLGRASW